MAMSKKPLEAVIKPRGGKKSPQQQQQQVTPPPRRQSPKTIHQQQQQQRTSPGLLAGHYAGCKFSEPPLPSALPPPPRHWMPHQGAVRLVNKTAQQQQVLLDPAQHLKMLLKVQA